MIYNAFPTTTGEGEEPSINGTAEVPFKEIGLKGNTSQDGEPTPDSPIPINVVSGDNTIKVEGKNLLSISSVKGYGYNFGLPDIETQLMVIDSFDSNSIIYHSTTSNYLIALTNIIKLKPNTTYTLSYKRTTTSTNNQVFVYDYDGSNYSINQRDNNTNLPKITFTTNNIGNIALAFGYAQVSGSTTISDIQIEVGDTKTTYEPYQSQSYPINLGNIELCKIGDYQDRIYKNGNKWYLEKQICKVVLNGSENWQQSGYTNDTIYSVYSGEITNYSYGQAISNLLVWNSNISSTTITEYISTGGATLRIGVLKSRLSAYTINEFKTWLSNNNVTTYYVLATPTTTEITDTTLISQLNALYNAYTYNDTTNISQTNANLPFYLDVNVYTKTDTKLDQKQNKLIAGTGIEITGENIINNIQGNYSTSETKIGTWMGKPLYRKVFELGTFTSVVSENPTSLNFSASINQVRKVEYNIYNNTNFINVPTNSYCPPDNNYFIYSQLGVRNNSYIVFVKSNRTLSDNYRVNVILEYTKTTD